MKTWIRAKKQEKLAQKKNDEIYLTHVFVFLYLRFLFFINIHLLLLNSPQIRGLIFDQIFGQGFDQGLGEGKSHKYNAQYYPASGKTP